MLRTNAAELALRFSALQRAEIAEIKQQQCSYATLQRVSVLFNEPKLLKFVVAEHRYGDWEKFQCSSTSRNC